jgi:hypothetical protein
MKNIIATTLNTLGLAVSEIAGSAEASPQLGGTCWASMSDSFSSDRPFSCQHLRGDKVTNDQNYERALRVVAMSQGPIPGGKVLLTQIIEKRNKAGCPTERSEHPASNP